MNGRASTDAALAGGDEMLELLRACLRIPSVSGSEGAFTRFVADWAHARGFEVDLWQADERSLPADPVAAPGHLPLAGRPTLVVRLPGTGGGRSVMFNAHADVVPPGDLSRWTHGPWSGDVATGNVFGRGACDVKGPLVSALWAMDALRAAPPRGDVLLELVPGEEDRVGLGTLTSVARGWRADASIVLEPTEGEPRCASRGGLRFTVELTGRAVHGTVRWLGRDAIALARRTLDALEQVEAEWNDRDADPRFDAYPYARPITVDSIRGGEWQGMVCDRCVIAGYLELLPDDSTAEFEQRFAEALRDRLGSDADGFIDVLYSERYDGHGESSNSPLCQSAAAAIGETSPAFRWQAFNSGCEAGLRNRVLTTPTLVWGPGTLAHAHAADERVGFADVATAADRFLGFTQRWCR